MPKNAHKDSHNAKKTVQLKIDLVGEPSDILW
jgi:hypothetical protein